MVKKIRDKVAPCGRILMERRSGNWNLFFRAPTQMNKIIETLVTKPTNIHKNENQPFENRGVAQKNQEGSPKIHAKMHQQ